MRVKFILFVMSMMLSNCTTKSTTSNDSKQVLKDYITTSFGIKSLSDRKELEKFLVGEAKIRISAWSEAQFYRAFIEVKREFGKLVFKETKDVSPTEQNVVYELSYIDQSKGHDAKVTQKKMATLINKEGHWFIESVRNLKETVEFRNELALP